MNAERPEGSGGGGHGGSGKRDDPGGEYVAKYPWPRPPGHFDKYGFHELALVFHEAEGTCRGLAIPPEGLSRADYVHWLASAAALLERIQKLAARSKHFVNNCAQEELSREPLSPDVDL